MITWLPRILPFLGKNWLALILVALLAGQQVQLWGARRDNAGLRQTIEAQKTEMAQARQAMQKLADAVAAMKPGDPPKVIYVPKPEYITLPGKEIPVIVTRTVHTIETKVETLQLPGKEIERIIREAPQSIVATMTALRDIKLGEKFVATFVQLQPGIWQPLVTPDSPIGIEAKVVTPIDRIPAPIPVPSRWSTAFLLGPDAFHPRGATVLTRAEIEYRLSARLFTRAELGWHWNSAGASGLLLLGTRF